MRIIVAAEVLRPKPMDLTDDRRLLLGLSTDDGIDLLVDSEDAQYLPEWAKLGSVSVGQMLGMGMRQVIAQGPRKLLRGACHEESRLAFGALLGRAELSDSADRIAAMLLAAPDFEVDLFVTCRHVLIATRNDPARLGASAGIVTPREALRIACAIQRGRGKFVVSEPTTSISCDETIFYSSLSNCHLPATLTALRSSLAPRLTPQKRVLAGYIESLLVKYQHLLIIADDIGRVTLAEGLHDATRSDSMRHVAHIQNSVILFASALDVLASVVGELGAVGQSESKSDHMAASDQGR